MLILAWIMVKMLSRLCWTAQYHTCKTSSNSIKVMMQVHKHFFLRQVFENITNRIERTAQIITPDQ